MTTKIPGLGRAVYRNFAKEVGANLGYGKKRGGGGRKLTIVLCEAQGGCYTLHLLCWHASNALSDYSLSHLMKIAIESLEVLSDSDLDKL